MQFHLFVGLVALMLASLTAIVSVMLWETLPGWLLFFNGFATGFAVVGGFNLLVNYQTGKESPVRRSRR